MWRTLSNVTLAVGLLAFGSGIFHTIAVTVVGIGQRKAYDLRLATLLVVGIAILLAGGALLAGGWWMRAERPEAIGLALAGGAAMFLASAALATVGEGFWIGTVLYGAYLLAFPFMLRV